MSPGRHHGSSNFLLSPTAKVSRWGGPEPSGSPVKEPGRKRAEWTTWMQSGSVKASKAPEGLAGLVS